MSLRKIFSKMFRRKETKTEHGLGDRIVCEDERIEKLIVDRCKSWGLMKTEFSQALDLIGLEMPVRLEEFKERKKSFICVTASGRIIEIDLDYYLKIKIREGKVIEEYCIRENKDNRVKRPLELYLYVREKYSDGKKLMSAYHDGNCCMTLWTDEIELQFSAASKEAYFGKSNEKFLEIRKTNEATEEYLISLDKSVVVVNEFFQKMMNLMNFSQEDIKNLEISVSYKEMFLGELRIREQIEYRCSKMVEYAYIEDKDTYHVRNDGYCEFISDMGIIICYNIQTGEVSIEWDHCNRELLEGVDLTALVNNVIDMFNRFFISNKEFFS